MSKTLHQYLTGLKTDVDNGEGEARTRALVRLALDRVNTSGDHGEMWHTARQSIGYVMDVAVNQGTAEDLRELRENLEHSPDYGAQPDNDQSERLLGQLYRHNYEPQEGFDSFSDTPLDAVLDAWNEEIGNAALQAVLAYVAENWEEDEDPNHEDGEALPCDTCAP